MNNEKTPSIFRTEKDKKEFVRLFRETTMSGAVSEDAAVEKIIRKNPHLFRVPSENEVKQTFNDVMNSEMRARARLSNRLSIDVFANVLPRDKKPS
jgi:hypothetical protein